MSSSVKALKEAQSSNDNQWPGLILSSYTSKFMMTLLPLCRKSDARVTSQNGLKTKTVLA